jgi:hypothetical protein
MTDFVTYQGKVAGGALLLSLLSLAVGLIIVAAQGKVYGLAAAIGIGGAVSGALIPAMDISRRLSPAIRISCIRNGSRAIWCALTALPAK